MTFSTIASYFIYNMTRTHIKISASSRADPEKQPGVSMQTQLDPNFDSNDLQEAPYVVKAKGYHPVVVSIGAALVSMTLALVLVIGMMPEMSPKQIVAMGGYQGRQPPRQIFNLDSLATSGEREPSQIMVTPQSAAGVKVSDRSQDRKVEPVVQTVVQPMVQTVVEPVVETAVQPVVETVEVDSNEAVVSSVADTDSFAALLAIDTEEPKDAWALEIVEVPASPIIVGKDAQEVSAPDVEEFDYRKLNRRTSNRDSIATTRTPEATAVQTQQGAPATTIKVLPVLTVNTDQAYVRAKPSQTSDIKLTLAKGMSVTAFEQAGAWFHVGANDGSSITGYVHQSSIAATEVN